MHFFQIPPELARSGKGSRSVTLDVLSSIVMSWRFRPNCCPSLVFSLQVRLSHEVLPLDSAANSISFVFGRFVNLVKLRIDVFAFGVRGTDEQSETGAVAGSGPLENPKVAV
jgi:hypothetical protein